MLCTKRFFNSREIPTIDLDEKTLRELAERSTNKGLTVTGVQKKLSLHLTEEAHPRLTIVDYPAGYILKPASGEYENLPEAEDLVMDIAEQMGVRTVPHGLIRNGNGFAYITKRIDRNEDREGNPVCLAMEDFCQLTGRATEDKYKSSYEKCTSVIKQYSIRRGLDLSEFYLRVVVSFLTGNSDMHLKNFSLIEQKPGNREFGLSPAYDLLPVTLLLPEDPDEMALTLAGKKSKIHRKDFLSLAEKCDMEQGTAEKLIDYTLKRIGKAEELCERSLLSPKQKNAFKELMRERALKLAE